MASQKWTPDEYARALELYFSGLGFGSVASELPGRSAAAVRDVIAHDIPRNYRDVIAGIAKASPKPSRSKTPWSRHEAEYLMALLKRLTVEQIGVVLRRSPSDVKKQMGKTRPKRGKERLA
jgi:hypothetical protein